MNTQYINLNMVPSGVLPVIYASQYDIGRPLGMVVYNSGESVDLGVYTCTIEATRTDGTAITAAVITDTNIAAFETTATMTNKADKYPAQLVLIDANQKRVASLPFIIAVVPAAMDENAEAIPEDASLYQQYTGTVQALIAQMRTELEADINAEKQARINAVSAEATARATEDQTLQNNINTEAATRLSADTTLQRNINSEAATRATADASLQSQINQIISPTGGAPSAAEVADARLGVNNITYDTLGNAIRGQVSDVIGELIKYNCYNMIPVNRIPRTTNGVSFTLSDYDVYIVNGTATSAAIFTIYNNATGFPDGIAPGNDIDVYYKTTSARETIYLQMFAYTSSGLVSTPFFTDSETHWNTAKTITVPSDAVGILIRLRVPQGITVNNAEVTPMVRTAPSNEQLKADITSIEQSIIPMSETFRYLNINETQASTEYSRTLSSIPRNTFLWTSTQWWDDAPTALGTFVYVYTFGRDGTTQGTQVAINPNTLYIASRRIQSGAWTAWADNMRDSGETISSDPSLVVYGDSLTWGAVWDSDQESGFYQAPIEDQIPTRIANAIGSSKVKNMGVSGARFVAQGESDTNAIIGDLIEDTDLTDVDLVVIGGGRNDSATALGDGDTATANDGTICGAIVAILEYLTTNFPELPVVVFGVTPQPTAGAHAPENIYTRVFAGGWSLNTYYTEVAKACARYGVPFIDWYDCTLILRWGQLSGGYSSGTQNWSHPLNEHIYMQMGNYLGGKVSSYYCG